MSTYQLIRLLIPIFRRFFIPDAEGRTQSLLEAVELIESFKNSKDETEHISEQIPAEKETTDH